MKLTYKQWLYRKVVGTRFIDRKIGKTDFLGGQNGDN